MRCDSCGKLLEYREKVVVTSRADNKLRATFEIEQSDLSVRGELAGKYHPHCYDQMRGADPSLPCTELGNRRAFTHYRACAPSLGSHRVG